MNFSKLLFASKRSLDELRLNRDWQSSMKTCVQVHCAGE